MNSTLTWHARAFLKNLIREFFDKRDYLELDTPIAVSCPGTEVHLGYFATAWKDFSGKQHPLYLRSSPELHLKQALSLGIPRLFQIAPCFRNEGELSEWHHPEFTMLEWYEAGIGFDAFIKETESLLAATREGMSHFCKKNGLAPPLPNLKFPLSQVSVFDAFQEFAGIELRDNDAELASKARDAGINSVKPDDDFETAYFKILIEKIEPVLAAMGGAVLKDYPPSQAALAKVKEDRAQRFEIYIGRVELSNGFLELLDAQENKKRIHEALQRRKTMGKDVPAEDTDFYGALSRGIPESCGNALGFDRWLALLLGESSLDAVIPFRRQGPFRSL